LYAAYGMSGKSVSKGTIATTTSRGVTTKERKTATQDIEFGKDKSLKQMDYGGQFGIGLEKDKIFVRLQYSLGLSSISHDKDETVRNGGFGLSLGYWINNAK